MAGIGLNPRFGWDREPYYPQGDGFNFGYDLPPAYDSGGYIPQPPPGYAWFDLGSVAPAPPWCMPPSVAPPIWAPWNPYAQYTQDANAGFNYGLQGAGGPGAFPGANFRNEPGYGYIFPQDHCKIHVLASASPPWLNAGPCEKRCFNVPTNITVKELMQQFGCTNPDPKKNRLVELTMGSDGTWYKGVEVEGSDVKKMAKRIDEIGWNGKRNGVDADFVWLWFAK